MGFPRQEYWRGLLFHSPGDLPEKVMTPHSTNLAWKIPWVEGTSRLQSMGLPRVRHNRVTSLSLFTFMHWRRNGNPLQCSSWWAAVYGVTQIRTRLKWLSSSNRSRGSFLPRDGTHVSCLAGISRLADGLFTPESPVKPNTDYKFYN